MDGMKVGLAYKIPGELGGVGDGPDSARFLGLAAALDVGCNRGPGGDARAPGSSLEFLWVLQEISSEMPGEAEAALTVARRLARCGHERADGQKDAPVLEGAARDETSVASRKVGAQALGKLRLDSTDDIRPAAEDGAQDEDEPDGESSVFTRTDLMEPVLGPTVGVAVAIELPAPIVDTSRETNVPGDQTRGFRVGPARVDAARDSALGYEEGIDDAASVTDGFSELAMGNCDDGVVRAQLGRDVDPMESRDEHARSYASGDRVDGAVIREAKEGVTTGEGGELAPAGPSELVMGEESTKSVQSDGMQCATMAGGDRVRSADSRRVDDVPSDGSIQEAANGEGQAEPKSISGIPLMGGGADKIGHARIGAGSGFWSVVELDGRAALLDDVESAMFLSGAMPVGSMGGRGRTVQMEMAERPAQRGGIEQAATSGKTPTVNVDRYYFRAGENGSGSHGAMMGGGTSGNRSTIWENARTATPIQADDRGRTDGRKAAPTNGGARRTHERSAASPKGATGEGEASVEGAFGTDRADTGGVWERGVSTDAFFANLQGDDFQGDIAGPEVGMGAGATGEPAYPSDVSGAASEGVLPHAGTVDSLSGLGRNAEMAITHLVAGQSEGDAQKGEAMDESSSRADARGEAVLQRRANQGQSSVRGVSDAESDEMASLWKSEASTADAFFSAIERDASAANMRDSSPITARSFVGDVSEENARAGAMERPGDRVADGSGRIAAPTEDIAPKSGNAVAGGFSADPDARLSASSGGGVGLGMTSGVRGRGIDSRLAEERPMGVEQEGVSHGSDGVDWAGTSNPKGIGGADEGKPERAELTEVESGAKARAGHGVSSRLHSDAEAAVSTAGSKLEAWRIQIADSQSMAERATSDAGLIKSDGFGVRPAWRQNIESGMDEGEESLAAREEADGADAADGESVLRVRVLEPDVTMRRDNTSSDMQSDARSRERSHGSREVVFEPRRESAQSGSEQIGHSDNGVVGFEGLVANLEAVNTGAAPTEGVPIDGRNRISDEAGRSMMRQIAAHIEARRGVGSGEFRAKLVPESLGEVRIRIKVQGGVCTATIRVGDSEVGKYIEEHGTDLKVLLAESGIDLADLSVSVGSHSASEGAREWTQGQYAAAAFAGGGRRGRKDYAPVEEWFCNSHRNELAPQEIELAAAYARSGHGRIDYFA